jgi:beta-glucosidase
VFVGNSSETEGEGRDRSNLALPGNQADLIKAISSTGVPTVVVLINGSPVLVKDWLGLVSGLVEAWYLGEQGGLAIAEVLFGRINPSGKLTITFPRTIGQLPLYYNPKPSGRDQGYQDESGTPQFPFGFGLSYTTFRYQNLEIVRLNSEHFTIHVDVVNTGSLAGEEIVQLYVHDVLASLSRPLKELKGFQRIHLDPGEIRSLVFDLPVCQLGFPDRRGAYLLEPGDFDILVGSSSEDIRLSGRLILAG